MEKNIYIVFKEYNIHFEKKKWQVNYSDYFDYFNLKFIYNSVPMYSLKLHKYLIFVYD